MCQCLLKFDVFFGVCVFLDVLVVLDRFAVLDYDFFCKKIFLSKVVKNILYLCRIK